MIVRVRAHDGEDFKLQDVTDDSYNESHTVTELHLDECRLLLSMVYLSPHLNSVENSGETSN